MKSCCRRYNQEQKIHQTAVQKWGPFLSAIINLVTYKAQLLSQWHCIMEPTEYRRFPTCLRIRYSFKEVWVCMNFEKYGTEDQCEQALYQHRWPTVLNCTENLTLWCNSTPSAPGHMPAVRLAGFLRLGGPVHIDCTSSKVRFSFTLSVSKHFTVSRHEIMEACLPEPIRQKQA